MLLDAQLVFRIDEKLKKLNSLRPLSPSVVSKLKQQFAIDMTYNSNAIEGNSLTLKETAWVIQDGLTIKGKPLKDHLEARDHYEALEFLYETIEHNKQQTISEVFIRTLHQLVVRETQREEAGKYRSVNVVITGSDHTPPDVNEVSVKMRDFIQWIKNNQKKLHPIELAALIHHKMVYVHPFIDGNGRTARLVMNLTLMHEGYPLVVVLKNDRGKYYRALSLDMYLKILLPAKTNKQKFVSLSALARETPYSKKYLNLLARLGKIEAHKEKRIWVTTKEAIERYIQNRLRKRNL